MVKSPPERRLSPTGPVMAAVWAGLVLCATLAVTWVTWKRAEASEELKLHTTFEYRARDAEARITRRMAANEQVLLGVAALFSAAEVVEREAFHDYVAALRLEEHDRGIQGVGFARADGGEGSSVAFLEPAQALGADLFASPGIQAAMASARDEARVVLSGKVALPQADVFLFAPVYGKGAAPGTAAERRARLVGWVFLPIRLRDLMQGTLGERGDDLATRISDGPSLTEAALLFDSAPGDRPDEEEARFKRERTLLVAGRLWTLHVHAQAPFRAHLASQTPPLVVLGGGCLSLLFTLLVWVLLGGRDRAVRWAREMNHDLLQANAALEESELRLRLALRGGELGVWDWDIPSGRVIFNERWAEMLGFTVAQLEPSVAGWARLIHPEDQPRVKALIAAHLKGETPAYTAEHRLRHQDGHWVWVVDSGLVVLRAPDGTALRAAGTQLDISEHKRTEEERKELLARSARADRAAALGTLASGMAHEINNPLSVVLSSVAFAQTELEGPRHDGLRAVREALADALEGTGRVRDLVADLQSLAMGQREPDARCELSGALERAARVSRHAHPPGTTLITELPPLPAVWGSEAELVQLFGCLLVNAAQAGGSGGLTVRISAEVRGEVVAVQISDTGRGIAPEILPRIFDPFFTTRRPGAKGLGLPVALGIARGLGGGVEVQSTVGQGTTVTVTLPVAPL